MDGISRLLIYSQFFPKGAYNMKKCLDENKVAILTGKAIQDDETFNLIKQEFPHLQGMNKIK